MNLGTIAVLGAVVLSSGAALTKIIKDKKSGKGGCCGDCSKCRGCNNK